MSAILGNHQFDLWRGPAPPAVKSTVELIFRPGQATAAAKILPNQSSETSFEAVAFFTLAGSHVYADSYRGIIGTIQPLLYGGVNWGHVLVRDVSVEEIAYLIHASGLHPDGNAYSFTPAARITSRWNVVRLSS